MFEIDWAIFAISIAILRIASIAVHYIISQFEINIFTNLVIIWLKLLSKIIGLPILYHKIKIYLLACKGLRLLFTSLCYRKKFSLLLWCLWSLIDSVVSGPFCNLWKLKGLLLYILLILYLYHSHYLSLLYLRCATRYPWLSPSWLPSVTHLSPLSRKGSHHVGLTKMNFLAYISVYIFIWAFGWMNHTRIIYRSWGLTAAEPPWFCRTCIKLYLRSKTKICDRVRYVFEVFIFEGWIHLREVAHLQLWSRQRCHY